MEKEKLIKMAMGQIKPELVLKNANIVNVMSGDISCGDVAISEGKIVGVGTYEGRVNEDMTGKYIMPGFINAHCHVESSMVTPLNYSCAELMWGTTTIITDPHEIVNVAGHKGIEYILDAAKQAPLNYYVQMPSCVPSTPFENAGAVMNAKDLAVYHDDSRVLGLGEMMNYVGVNNCDKDVLDKLDRFCDKVIDGHAPGLCGNELNAYVAAGIDTEHECVTYEEALEKLRAGLAILIREGGASKNLEAIVAGVIKNGTDTFNMAFATDDKHLYDIYNEGTIRNNIVKAVAMGMNPVTAIQIATINAARIYGLKKTGAIVPGYDADIVVADNLTDMNIERVYKDGVLVARDRNIMDFVTCSAKKVTEDAIIHSVHIKKMNKDSLKVAAKDVYPVIKMIPGQIVTGCEMISADALDKMINNGEILKIAVIERHHATGNIGTGYIMGYGLKNGAVATTVAHDSHNLIVVGDNDDDMLKAVKEIERINGGYAIVSGGEISSFSLGICGLMSEEEPHIFIEKLGNMIQKARELGVNEGIDPFTTLSFMALPVIPSLRITDMGMFNVDKWSFEK